MPKPDLDELTSRLIAAFAGELKLPGDDRQDATLRRVESASNLWASSAKRNWTEEDKKLWERLLDACYDAELECLKRHGYLEKSAKKLVRREQSWWDPTSRHFAAGSSAPEFRSTVPVVVVQREGGFRIHAEILVKLWQHPSFTDDLSSVSSAKARSESDDFKNTLELAQSIADDYGLDDWEYFPAYEELDGPDQWAFACIMAELELQQALGPTEARSGDFIDDHAFTLVEAQRDDAFCDEVTEKVEDLAWLAKAKQGNRFWQLLNAAVKLGQSLNGYSTFRDPDIEDAIRRMHTANLGRETSPPGEAVECIIRKFLKVRQGHPTPKNLLTWLNGKRPISDDSPLIVNNPLWGSVLNEVSWRKFKDLVKSARRRVERDN